MKTLKVPVLPIFNVVFFPHTAVPLQLVNPVGIQMIKDCVEANSPVALSLTYNSQTEAVSPVQKTCGVGIPIILEEKRNFLKVLVVGMSKVRLLKPVKTAPYPGFPTDLQAQIMVLLCKAKKNSYIKEDIFENRFMHVAELNRMGANISIKGNVASISGKTNFIGAELMATDLRASVSLVLAALNAKGKSIINRIYHLDRGYEHIEKKLKKVGSKIRRIN